MTSDRRVNPATIVRVIDADTVVCVVDIGWRVSIEATVRLAGIDAPERHTSAGDAATEAATAWVAAHGPAVTLTSLRARDRYGRHLAQLVAGDGADLAADLVAAGHARPWDGHGPRP